MTGGSTFLDLYDFRVRVLSMYRRRNESLLRGDDPTTIWQHFWEDRTDLFANHPQSALNEAQKRAFTALPVFPYNPAAVVEASLDTDVEPQRFEIHTSGEEAMPMSLVGTVDFHL